VVLEKSKRRLRNLLFPRAAMAISACGDFDFRVRNLPILAAKISFPACRNLKDVKNYLKIPTVFWRCVEVRL
jgi:hypothetical protein